MESLKKTPDGKRRRSELEKILAKNAHYKKLKEDHEFASKQCPIPDTKTKSGEKEVELLDITGTYNKILYF